MSRGAQKSKKPYIVIILNDLSSRKWKSYSLLPLQHSEAKAAMTAVAFIAFAFEAEAAAVFFINIYSIEYFPGKVLAVIMGGHKGRKIIALFEKCCCEFFPVSSSSRY